MEKPEEKDRRRKRRRRRKAKRRGIFTPKKLNVKAPEEKRSKASPGKECAGEGGTNKPSREGRRWQRGKPNCAGTHLPRRPPRGGRHPRAQLPA